MTTTKLIAQKSILTSHFSSATEQAGPTIAQPTPGTGNQGKFRLQSGYASAPVDFTFSGVTTAGGSTTTAVDTSELRWFGDDFFIDGTLTIDSGGASGQSQTISDYVQSTGTITVSSAFSTSILSGVSYTITIPFNTRDYNFEVVTGGEVETGTFKWNHDGSTWLGRSDPSSGTWYGGIELADDGSNEDAGTHIVKAANGNLVAAYTDNSGSPEAVVKISTDKGITWGAKASLGTSSTDGSVYCMIALQSGRIIAGQDSHIVYSDDYGVNWTTITDVVDASTMVESLAQHVSGTIYLFYESSGIKCVTSGDDGLSFPSSAVSVASATGTQRNPYAINPLNETYELICAYETEEDFGSRYEIKTATLVDGTWTDSTDCIDWSSVNINNPVLCLDINGDIYCGASENSNIVFSISTDGGTTWNSASPTTILNDGNTLDSGGLFQVDGHSIWCAIADTTNQTVKLYRRGEWTTAGSCPIPGNLTPQVLVNNIEIKWLGGSAIAADTWEFLPDFYYSGKNILTDQPSKSWRSTQDNIACNLLYDFGANAREYVDSVAFFNCNVRTLDFQMNATDSWGSPTLDEAISFDLTTGAIDEVDGNYIRDTSVLANYKDHELSGLYFRATSGTDSGVTWDIKDNIGNWIVLDTTAAHNLASPNAFVIYQDHIAKTFTGDILRYMRPAAITAQHTPDNYYEIGMMIAGPVLSLTRTYAPGYGVGHSLNVTPLVTPAGGVNTIKRQDVSRSWKLTWQASLNTAQEIEHLIRHFDAGQNIAFIPDDSDLTKCYLTKSLNGLQYVNWAGTNRFHFALILVEVL